MSVVATPKTFAKIAENLRTQDNRATGHPVFVVQQRRRIYGLDPEHLDERAWVRPDAMNGIVWMHDGEELNATESEAMELLYEKNEDIDPEYTRTGYIDIWETMTPCFTEAGCKEYLEANGHNLNKPRIYVDSAHRNYEWQAIRQALLAQTLAPGIHLAPKHQGMRVNAKGLLSNVSMDLTGPRATGYQEAIRQLIGHLEEMATQYYDGNPLIVDEFLQLYSLDKNRPKS